MNVFEVNFDGLVGPTHNYAGLSFGNLASTQNKSRVASPKRAALQGLAKMKSLADLGLKQAVLPPHERPYLSCLSKLGFSANTDAELLEKAAKQAPEIFRSLCSASNMWVANAATVSPFPDTEDGKTHFTPANLSSMFHRSIEHEQTSRILRTIFHSDDYVHHPALPQGAFFSDEGAANHTRLSSDSNYGSASVELFVYGASVFDGSKTKPTMYPARQTREASEAIARQHLLRDSKTVFAQQNPKAIDAGVFHNDVIAVGNQNLFFYHQDAFSQPAKLRDALDQASGGAGIDYFEVPRSEVSIQDAVSSYMFNTQLLSLPDEPGNIIIAPTECQEVETVRAYFDWLKSSHSAIRDIHYFDLKESMSNGGGPACLRLRVVMSEQQINDVEPRVMLDDSLYSELQTWVNRHYRDELHGDDLVDPALLKEVQSALDELTQIMRLGDIYDFQSSGSPL